MTAELELLALGPQGGGKTFLIRRLESLLNGTNSKHDLALLQSSTAPTIGQEVATIVLNSRATLKIREVGGSMSSGWSSYLDMCTAMMYVIDVADSTCISTIIQQLHELLFHISMRNKNVLIIFNKIDLTNPTSIHIMMNLLRIKDLSLRKDTHIQYVSVSAYDTISVNLILNWIRSTFATR
jgi:GTPase SAR1 family protein